jgi:hypothetical protein
MNPPDAAPASSETARSIAGALRFCRFDAGAVTVFDPSPATALRSFLAPLYGLPFYVAILALDLWHAPRMPDDLALYALVQLIAYVAQVAGFPLAVLGLTRFLGHVEQWPLFVTAQNWFGLPQVAFVLVAVIIDRSGILGSAGALIAIALWFYSLAVEAFISRVTLGVNPLAAVAIVLLDVVIGVGIDKLTAGLA